MPMVRVLSRVLDIVIAPAMLISLALAFLYAPDEATMKSVYRIFFFHVPAAASSFVGFGIVFLCSIMYLRTRKQVYDLVAAAAAEVGVVFCVVGVVMGMLWAKPVWGTYWIPGDVHLMTTAVPALRTTSGGRACPRLSASSALPAFPSSIFRSGSSRLGTTPCSWDLSHACS
jgi:heme exporter protein C